MSKRTPFSKRILDTSTSLVLAFCFLVANPAAATTDAEEMEVCRTEMLDNQGASNIRDLEPVEHEDREYARGKADFTGIEGLYFRCRVSDGKVTKVEYLVPDPDYVDKKKWTTDRPKPKSQSVIELYPTAEPSSPPVATSPKFETVPD